MGLRNAAAATASLALAVAASGCSTTITTTPSIAPPEGCALDGAPACETGYGLRCAAGDEPQNEQQGISCSAPEPDSVDPALDDYCCIAWTSTSTCTPDPSVAHCAYPSFGYDCEQGDSPEAVAPSLECASSGPDPDGVHDDYCCQ